MAIYAFFDADDGYYEVVADDSDHLPAWTSGLTPCAVRPSAFHYWNGLAWVLDQAAQDADADVKTRIATDVAEADTDKADVNLKAVLDMTDAQIGTAINNAFTDPAQRTIIRRLARLTIHAARGRALR